MENQELNRKLAEWRWPDATSIQLQPGPKLICITFSDKTSIISFYFTHDLNACFEWLVPKQDTIHNIGVIELVFMPDGPSPPDSWICRVYLMVSDKSGRGEGKTPALALCKAIEQLIDSKTESKRSN